MSQAALTIANIQQALNGPLPGMAGQKKMAPAPMGQNYDRWDFPDDCREASVLLLLYPFNNKLHIAFIRRPTYPGVHSGQIAFPGGQRENGEPLNITALRETEEEIGVLPETVKIIGRLSPLYTPPSNFCIQPFVGFTTCRPVFKPDAREVAELIEVPLSLFFKTQTQKTEIWHFEDYGRRHVPFFYVADHKIWGATAMILSELLTLLNPKQKPK